MKSARFTLPALLAGVMAVSPQALASVDNEELSVGLRLGMYNFDDSRQDDVNNTLFNVDSGFKNVAPGIQLNVPLTDTWSLRSYFDYVKADLDGSSASADGYSIGVDALYRLTNGFYFGGGLNTTKTGEDSGRGLRGTAGYRRAINDNLSWSLEYAMQFGDFTDSAIIAGLNMSFGDGGSALTQIRSSAEEEARRQAIAARRDSEVAPTTDAGGVDTTRRDSTMAYRSDEELAPQIRAALVDIDRTADEDGDGVPDYRDVCQNTSRGHAVDARGCSVYEEQSQVHHLRVNFGFDSAMVPEEYYGYIRELAVLVGVYPELEILIEGHTDLIGPEEYNQRLSERRAQAVADILTNQFGIDASRITTIGHGMSQPVVNRITLDANARNRRIEATVTVTESVPSRD
ncbi:OmpA family protein [Lysobacter sp. N42]|uniref:OmpA family protein n=2 Tax=Gammaproteobacteria TaxID=1236 RepID=UPI002111B00A|nr:OmpA family protein [Lysobacter sp. N42]